METPITHGSEIAVSETNGSDRGRAESRGQDEPPRKRARLSCNTCKARKTKCTGFETGACQYCRSLNLPCEASIRSRKRPFYRVSGEVYEYSIKLLRRFVPEDELPELTVEKIQEVMQRLDSVPETPSSLSSVQRLPALPAPSTVPAVTPPAGESVRSKGARAPLGEGEGEGDGVTETMEPNEHPGLQEEQGCMLLDSMGKYRYVGANSSIRWFNATRTVRDNHPNPDPYSQPNPQTQSPTATTTTRPDPKIITPLNIGLLPPTTPESGRPSGVYLPPRPAAMNYVTRFFDQVHCIYWFFSAEQFYPLLDQTLEDRGASASSSWLCALYSIFAIGSMKEDRAPAMVSGGEGDTKTALEYLAMARDFSAGAADEADLDSVKAFGLLSLAMHGLCYSITAYLHVGTAVRIGYSLGLHRDVFLRSKGSLERERSRRLWWTIYVLDYEMASRFGYPCSVIEDAVFMSTSPATEEILDPGPKTPLGFQALLVSLAHMTKTTSHDCFLEPAHVGGRLPISRVTRALSALRAWHAAIPVHLRWDSSLHPQHRRAVSILHLRYRAATITLTRPFLLFTVARAHTANPNPAKRALYEQLSNTCIEATEAAVEIIRRMREDGTLSSLMLFDTHCLGDVMDILIMALQKLGGAERLGMLRFCLETFRGMERVGWNERLSPEVESSVAENAVLKPGAVQPAQVAGTPFSMATGGGPIFPFDNDMPSLSDYLEPNFDGSQFDVFETLDLGSGTGMMEMFTDASFSGAQFVFDNPGRVHQM